MASSSFSRVTHIYILLLYTTYVRALLLLLLYRYTCTISYNSCQLYVYVCAYYVIRQPLGWRRRRWVGCAAYRRVGYRRSGIRTRTRDYAASLDSEGARATSSRARVCGPWRCRLVWHGTGATVGGPGRRSSGPHSASSQLPPHDRYAILLDSDAATTAAAVTRHHRRTPSSTTLRFLINIYMNYNRCMRLTGVYSPETADIPVGSQYTIWVISRTIML